MVYEIVLFAIVRHMASRDKVTQLASISFAMSSCTFLLFGYKQLLCKTLALDEESNRKADYSISKKKTGLAPTPFICDVMLYKVHSAEMEERTP